MRQMSSEQIDVVMAVVTSARQIVAGDKPTLTHGWKELTAQEAGFYNDVQRRTYVPLSHEDYDAVQAANKVLATLGLAPSLMPGLDMRRFVLATRPAV